MNFLSLLNSLGSNLLNLGPKCINLYALHGQRVSFAIFHGLMENRLAAKITRIFQAVRFTTSDPD